MRLAIATAVALAILVPKEALADSLGSRANQRGKITKISKGAKQLALDSTLIVGYNQEQDTSTFMLNAVGSASFRYFIKDNLGLSGRLGAIIRKAGDTTNLGTVGGVWINRFMRLSEGMFFAPGVGAGVMWTQRDTPMEGGNVARSTAIGGIGAAEFMLAVFLNPRFSLSAGPEAVLTVGGTSPEEGDGTSFVTIDGGFKVGVAYAF